MQRIHDKAEDFGNRDLFNVMSQLRRSTAALPTYIAKGCCNGDNESRAISLEVGFGTVCEAEYQLFIARGRGYIPMDEYQKLSEEFIAIKGMLAKIVGELRSAPVRSTENKGINHGRDKIAAVCREA
jgi:four helix bundle protein